MATMDPDVAFATAIDPNAYADERHAAARNLLTWLYGGGFMPHQFSGTRADLCELLREIRDGLPPAPVADAAPFDPQPNR